MHLYFFILLSSVAFSVIHHPPYPLTYTHTGHYFCYGLVKYRFLFHDFSNHYLGFYMIKCETNIAFTALKLIIHSPTRYDTSEVKLILCLIKQCREYYNHLTLVFPFKIIQLENPHLFGELIL